MITISDNLAAATAASSRTPAVRVTLENHGIDEPTVLVSDGSLPYRLRRFQQGDGFYIATAYSGSTIYYKRMTSVENASDWTSGWSSLVTVTANGAKFHDMYISGDRVIVAYEKTAKVVYTKESTDQGQTWNAEQGVVDFGSSEEYAYWVSIADELTMFIAGRYLNYWSGTSISIWGFRIWRASRPNTSTNFSIDDYWDLGRRHIVTYESSANDENINIFARPIDDRYRVTAKLMKGPHNLSNTQFIYAFYVDVENDHWGVMDSAFGGYTLDSSRYFFGMNGLSRNFNGYYFTFTSEKYPPGIDANGYDVAEIIERYHIARTRDLKGYDMIPWPDPLTPSGTDFLPFLTGVGLSESGDYMCIPASYWTSNGMVYLLPVSSWFGEAISETDITPYVIENISINRQISKAATATMQVSCRTGTFEGHDLTQPNALIRVDAGYNTASGEEMTERFAGYVMGHSRSVGPDAVLSLNLMDRLAHATARQERLPHILKGQNTFFTNFADPLDIDMFVTQLGSWEVGPGGRLRNSSMQTNITFAGFDPTDTLIMRAKIRFTVSHSSTRFGLVFHSTKWAAPGDIERTYHKVFFWDGSTTRFRFGEVVSAGDYINLIPDHATSLSTLGCVPNTDYWLMCRVKHGRLDGWYSLNGTSWTEVLSNVDIGYSDGPYGNPWLCLDSSAYVGLYSFAPDGSSQSIRFDDIAISSMYPPVTGSTAMKYLAAIAGLGHSEEMNIDDDFSGASFSSRWDTPGVDGSWSVSGGHAIGYKTGATGTLLACDTSSRDIAVTANVEVASDACGIFVRGSDSLDDCYAFYIDTAGYGIVMRSGGSWSTLQYVPKIRSLGTYAKITLVARGDFISGYINNQLEVFVRDTTHTNGTCGMTSDATSGDPSLFDEFSIDAFYIPLDVVTVRPGDKAASVMDQVAGMYDDGYYYVGPGGNLVWGILDTSAADIDSRARIIDLNISRDFGEILSFVRAIGDNSYNEAADVAWGRALSGHRYGVMEDKYVSTRLACAEAAERALNESQKIETNSIVIPGHPALELTDVLTISEEPGEAGTNHAVMSFSETIGDSYDMTIAELRSMTPEEP